ncbi:MAG: hypothetical protein Q8O26_19480 [Phreatobacter sp.]|nr:hypothetical protein [Phreatobacter sp.]
MPVEISHVDIRSPAEPADEFAQVGRGEGLVVQVIDDRLGDMEPRVTAMTEGIAAQDQCILQAVPAEETPRAGDQLIFMSGPAVSPNLLSQPGELIGHPGFNLVKAGNRLQSGGACGQCGSVFGVREHHARAQQGKHPLWQWAKSAPDRASQKTPHWPAPLPVRAAVPAK